MLNADKMAPHISPVMVQNIRLGICRFDEAINAASFGAGVSDDINAVVAAGTAFTTSATSTNPSVPLSYYVFVANFRSGPPSLEKREGVNSPLLPKNTTNRKSATNATSPTRGTSTNPSVPLSYYILVATLYSGTPFLEKREGANSPLLPKNTTNRKSATNATNHTRAIYSPGGVQNPFGALPVKDGLQGVSPFLNAEGVLNPSGVKSATNATNPAGNTINSSKLNSGLISVCKAVPGLLTNCVNLSQDKKRLPECGQAGKNARYKTLFIYLFQP